MFPRSRLGKLLTFLGLIIIFLVAATGAEFYGQYHRAGPQDQDVSVDIPSGTGVARISELLTYNGVLDEEGRFLFRISTRLTGSHRDLKAGEYIIPAHASIADVVKILSSGKTLDRFLTVIEGETVYQAVQRLRENKYLKGAVIDLPAEGSLLPETYQFKKGELRVLVLKRMQDAMTAALQTAWENRDLSLALRSPAEVVILASIVEKETALSAERERIAAVFLNRLKRHIKLQADPTVIYGLTGGKGALGYRLLTKHLEKDSPYNTYTRYGLPAGPIANPSLASIKAVTNPISTNELYFVADGTGGHVFASTLSEHNINVSRWRKIRRQRGN